MMLPSLNYAAKLDANCARAFIGAYGFEDRMLGWVKMQPKISKLLTAAFVFRYKHPKGANRILDLQTSLKGLGIKTPNEVIYDFRKPHAIEDELEAQLRVSSFDEVVLDTSGMTKLLILASLCKLSTFAGTLRIIYSESQHYCPNMGQYAALKKNMAVINKFPSRGAEMIVRLRCLSSIRMQGQPVTLIAFTSFNEVLVSHILGFLSPHRLLFINGRPPRTDYLWREMATQEIHKKLIDQFSKDNSLLKGLLKRSTSTLYYYDTIQCIDDIYSEYGTHERIICAATGSKMQTVGLYFSKVRHPDIHIEYPTPDSYYVKGLSTGIRAVHEVIIPKFSEFLIKLHNSPLSFPHDVIGKTSAN